MIIYLLMILQFEQVPEGTACLCFSVAAGPAPLRLGLYPSDGSLTCLVWKSPQSAFLTLAEILDKLVQVLGGCQGVAAGRTWQGQAQLLWLEMMN